MPFISLDDKAQTIDLSDDSCAKVKVMPAIPIGPSKITQIWVGNNY